MNKCGAALADLLVWTTIDYSSLIYLTLNVQFELDIFSFKLYELLEPN